MTYSRYQDLYSGFTDMAPLPPPMNPTVSALRMPAPPPRRGNSGPNMSDVAKKIAKKYFGQDKAMTSAEATKVLTSDAAYSGAGTQAFPIGEATGSIAPTASLAPGSTMAAAQGGSAGSLGASLHGGSTFSGTGSALSAAAPAAAALAVMTAPAWMGTDNDPADVAYRNFNQGKGTPIPGTDYKITSEDGSTFLSGGDQAAMDALGDRYVNPNVGKPGMCYLWDADPQSIIQALRNG